MDGDVGGVSLHRSLHGLQCALAAARATHSELQRLEDGGKVPRIQRVAHLRGDLDKQVTQRQRSEVVTVGLGDALQDGACEQLAAVFVQVVVGDEQRQSIAEGSSRAWTHCPCQRCCKEHPQDSAAAQWALQGAV
jgi:hypothetical protein